MITAYELDLMLRSVGNIELLDTTELTKLFGNDFSLIKGYDQNNPHHCYDLLMHTIQTVNNLDVFCKDASALPLLKVAALFHDIGKPQVMQEKTAGMFFMVMRIDQQP